MAKKTTKSRNMGKNTTTTSRKTIATLRHQEAKRKNIPTAELQSVFKAEQQQPIELLYPRNTDLDPQLVWRGKDQQNWNDLVIHVPPLYIQEKVHPKVLIDDLLKQSKKAKAQESGAQADLFADFNGIAPDVDRTEFYQHDQNWSNRMILGDSLQVMASLVEREGLRGQVQCIYFDPPYGIKFNSNFQWSTSSTTAKDGKAAHITREPEQVRAFRDTWRDSIHSYLTYLRDRMTVARDLLCESGSIFVQIGEENVHRVRALMDEVFGDGNFVSAISYKTSIGLGAEYIDNTCNYLLWYARTFDALKFRPLFRLLEPGKHGATRYKRVRLPDLSERSVENEELDDPGGLPVGARLFRDQGLTSRSASDNRLPGVGVWRHLLSIHRGVENITARDG